MKGPPCEPATFLFFLLDEPRPNERNTEKMKGLALALAWPWPGAGLALAWPWPGLALALALAWPLAWPWPWPWPWPNGLMILNDVKTEVASEFAAQLLCRKSSLKTYRFRLECRFLGRARSTQICMEFFLSASCEVFPPLLTRVGSNTKSIPKAYPACSV